MCDLFTMIIMLRSNYLIVVNDGPKYSGCLACNHVRINNDYLVCTVRDFALKVLFTMTLLITIVS